MKISLNKANKFRNILAILPLSMVISAEVPSYVDAEARFDILKQGFQEHSNALKSSFTKNTVLFELRRLIDEANHKEGVSNLISSIAETQEKIKIIQSWLTQIQNSKRVLITQEAMEQDIIHRKKIEEKNPELAQGPKKYMVSVLNDYNIKDLETALAKNKKELMEFQEERNALNHKVTIELPDYVVNFLREVNLV